MSSNHKGIELEEHKKKLIDNRYALRVGNEVPEGDVNLAYLHTPRVDSDENIALMDTLITPDNIIPEDQMESIVIPDQEGKLHYATIVSDNHPVQERPPYHIFPTDKVFLTREFKRDEHTTDNALYYKFEIQYHYDSKKGKPNIVEKYQGDLIQLTDENGNLLLDDYKYDIYVMAMEENPNIHWVKIYLHMNTNTIDTFQIRYNHIDEVRIDDAIQSSHKKIELYRNNKNQIEVDGENKALLESGKLRIINGVSAFEKVDEDEFKNLDEDDEGFKVVEVPNQDGYQLYVPQKSEIDPRAYRAFNYKVVAKYLNEDGHEQRVSLGYINDWVINKEALLKHEEIEYTQGWKKLGFPMAGNRTDFKSMIEYSLPIGTPSVPEEAEYEIYDSQGILMYTVTDSPDNPNVETQLNEAENNAAQAMALNTDSEPWKNASKKNVRVKNLPIPHRASIIAESQKTHWPFSFKATGQGVIRTPTVFESSWWVCAQVGVYKGFSTDALDVVNRNRWQIVGNNVTHADWVVKTRDDGISYIELQKNLVEVAGFYQRIDPDGEDMMTKSDYEFSAKVRTLDHGDDDIISLLFRVQDTQNYYIFVWERDDLLSENWVYKPEDFPPNPGPEKPVINGTGKIIFGEGGCSAVHYQEGYEYDNPKPENQNFITDNWKSYNEDYGVGLHKKRIYKATTRPSSVPPYIGYAPGRGDVTGSSFHDITTEGSTFNSTAGKKGWVPGQEYKLTVMVTGNKFQVYINENPDAEDKGTLVCEATDNTYSTGSVGVAAISQRWTQWRDMTYNELDVSEICTEKTDIILDSKEEVKLSEERVTELLKPLIDEYAEEKYGEAVYEVFGYNANASDSDLKLTIDEAGKGYVWGSTNNSLAGGVQEDPWNTTSEGYDIYGSGSVEFHADGHSTIRISPEKLPTHIIPENVEDFRWNTPTKIDGGNISFSLDSDNETIKTSSSPEPIQQLDKWITTAEDEILKEEEIKHIMQVDGKDGAIEQLGLPSSLELDELLLRIERGKATGPFNASNQEHRVNYRFRVYKDGLIRFPVDQFKDQLGVNRIRMSSLYNEFKTISFKVEFSINVDSKTIKGTTDVLRYKGTPQVYVTHDTRVFCHPYVQEALIENGYDSTQPYTVNYYKAVEQSEGGVVNVSKSGIGPIQVYSDKDYSESIPSIDLIGWTHYQELEAVPIFALKIEDDKKIELEKPKIELSKMETSNWYLRVKNGKFQKKIELPYYEPEERTPSIYDAYPELIPYAPDDPNESVEITLQYKTPEYSNQEFQNRPIMLVERERPIILDEYSIKTRYQNIVLESEYGISYLDVEAIRNDEGRKLKIKDIDVRKGIIYLHDRIREQDDVLIRYTYLEDWYTYRGYKHEVVDNKRAAGSSSFFHLDLNPTSGHKHTVAKDEFFGWIPIDTEEGFQVEDVSNQELLVKTIYTYIRPNLIKVLIDGEEEIVEGTQREKVLFHTTEQAWFNSRDYKFDPTMLKLGKIIVQENSSIQQDKIILDTRTRGGGLDESISRKIIEEVNRESLYNWDIGYFDGEAYQENGVIIIRLPETILKSKDNPNGFHENEVLEAVQTHKAYGVLPIIEYYNPEELPKKAFPKDIDLSNAEVHEI